jgi:hypothetical protein
MVEGVSEAVYETGDTLEDAADEWLPVGEALGLL